MAVLIMRPAIMECNGNLEHFYRKQWNVYIRKIELVRISSMKNVKGKTWSSGKR